VRGSFIPECFGADESMLVLEDLTQAEWPPPWTQGRVDLVLAALDELHATTAPAGLPRLEEMRGDVIGWPRVADDPEPFLSTRVASREWFDAARPTLLQASAAAHLKGDELMHFDVRSDNLCFRNGSAVLVDWNIACAGNGRFDVAFWLPSLRLEGGPEPWEVLPDAGELAAAVAGFFAVRAGLPPPEGAPTVREFQRRQLEVALPWAARELRIAPP
jgi:aminoglycoside phosphotransferase (APT) family kinase protein